MRHSISTIPRSVWLLLLILTIAVGLIFWGQERADSQDGTRHLVVYETGETVEPPTPTSNVSVSPTLTPAQVEAIMQSAFRDAVAAGTGTAIPEVSPDPGSTVAAP